jgi:N-methylhydantoinase A
MPMRVGIDTGGTFTDLVAFDAETGVVTTSKAASRGADPIVAFREALAVAGAPWEAVETLVHGTTVATNALIERKGARVALLTTEGFEDLPFIQRINRRELYNLGWVKAAPLVDSRASCFGLRERILADGSVLRPLDETHVRRVCAAIADGGYEAVAVCLLFSYLNPEHEERVGDLLTECLPHLPRSLSHRVAPIWREYERASTAIADAYLMPLVSGYLSNLDLGLRAAGLRGPWMLMKSNGGVVAAEAAAANPIQLAMSGPAGGLIACRAFAELADAPDVFTLDMGGTSCDVGILVGGRQRHTSEYEIEFGLPAAIPLIDIKTIGAGGGSIAWVDGGGFLQVGPRSAGSSPGPACYGQGGGEPTVTDANLYLGRLNPEYFLDGRMPLSPALATGALQKLAAELGLDALELASSIVEIADDNMANATRMVGIERGHDPRGFALIAFGGAGPLHAASIAHKLSVPRVLIPPAPGNASALGLLLADLRIDRVRTQAMRSDQADPAVLGERLTEMRQQAEEELRREGYHGSPLIEYALSMRYLGQNYEHELLLSPPPFTPETLALLFSEFHALHEQLYGYRIPHAVIEVISARVTVVGPVRTPQLPVLPPAGPGLAPGSHRRVYFRTHGWLDTPIYRRVTLGAGAALEGPAVIEEPGSTTLVTPGARMTVLPHGLLSIELGEEERVGAG